MDIINLRSISFDRDRRRILDGVNWRVGRGQHWVLLGANGAGKTTLLRIVCGMLWPTCGQAEVLGEPYGQVDLRELRRRIGWFSSSLEPSVSPRERAGDLVASGRFATLGLQFDEPSADDRRRALELLGFLDAAHVADQPFATLSQGERQKVLIARALMPRPELLILDEPCTGLDLPSRERLLSSIDKLTRCDGLGGCGRAERPQNNEPSERRWHGLAQPGHDQSPKRPQTSPTLILVTHHLEEITPGFSHAMLLKEGRVEAQGRLAEVLTDEILSQAFDLPLHVRHRHGRYSAAAPAAPAVSDRHWLPQ